MKLGQIMEVQRHRKGFALWLSKFGNLKSLPPPIIYVALMSERHRFQRDTAANCDMDQDKSTGEFKITDSYSLSTTQRLQIHNNHVQGIFSMPLHQVHRRHSLRHHLSCRNPWSAAVVFVVGRDFLWGFAAIGFRSFGWAVGGLEVMSSIEVPVLKQSLKAMWISLSAYM